LLVLQQIGIIAVDVKERKINPTYEDFILDEKKEIMKYSSFERIFRNPV